MSESYDQRRERCMLDQSSGVGEPLGAILGAPAALQRRYAGRHEDIRALIASLNALAAGGARARGPGREGLADEADRLREKYAAEGLLELSGLLENAAAYLRGAHPLRPVGILPSLELDR